MYRYCFIYTRLSRDEKKFQKELHKALTVSKNTVDTSLVLINEHADKDEPIIDQQSTDNSNNDDTNGGIRRNTDDDDDSMHNMTG